MKKILISVFVTLAFTNISFSQTPLTLDYSTIYGSSVIKSTWSNLSKMLFANMSSFRATMSKYNYSLGSDGSGYIANTSPGSPYFMINKSNNDVNMIFTSDDGFVSDFRTELRQKLKSGNISYERGFEVYRIKYEHEGFTYKIKITLKEEQNGSSMVGLILQ